MLKNIKHMEHYKRSESHQYIFSQEEYQSATREQLIYICYKLGLEIQTKITSRKQNYYQNIFRQIIHSNTSVISSKNGKIR